MIVRVLLLSRNGLPKKDTKQFRMVRYFTITDHLVDMDRFF